MTWQPTLENDLIILSPLKEQDSEALFNVAADPLIWEQHPVKNRSQKEGFERFFKASLASKGALLIKAKKTGEIIGSSRFQMLENNPDKIEIGWTFLARKYWGGPYNKAAKTLMIDYAFQFVKTVVFLIDKNNIRSQKAVEKIGAKRVRQPDTINIDAKSPDNRVFTITKKEWEKQKIEALLVEVSDPEIPVLSIMDMGIVRDIQQEGREVLVKITPTYSGCPAMDTIAMEIKIALDRVGYQAKVKSILSPAWTTDWITENGRQKLEAYGIAPPMEATADKLALLDGEKIVPCPRCQSTDTKMISQFGSTACKALFQCNDCFEPFDYFKCLK